MTPIPRRAFVQKIAAASALAMLPSRQGHAAEPDPGLTPTAADEQGTVMSGSPALEHALRIALGVYRKNRVKDMMCFFNPTGHRMKVESADRCSICMSPDLTFAVLGSRSLLDDAPLQTLLGHLDALPRNMRRNGKFFINEDLLAGAGRVMSQVMYLIWIWELYLATGDQAILRRHREPLRRCLAYIASRTNAEGIVRQVDPDDWQLSEGADWVDWSPERMEGSTCVYHTWYVRALEHCVQIFKLLGDEPEAARIETRRVRQRRVLDTHFWNGHAYYDNLDFGGRKVDHFWCDSQIWPIAFGYASAEQRKAIFARIDAQPDVFEGMPLRWCAPLAKEDEGSPYPEMPAEPAHRPMSWFGRLGSGDVLARCVAGNPQHALDLLEKYAAMVVRYGSFPECVDMTGTSTFGTGGGRDYLEHAAGLLLAVSRGLWGIDDTTDGTIRWSPQLPDSINHGIISFRHLGRVWQFECDQEAYWIDPRGATERIRFQLGDRVQEITLTGNRTRLASRTADKSK